jgi:hypothetical protein
VRQFCRKTYTFRFKLHVINFYAKAGIKTTVERFFSEAAGASNSSAHKLINKWSRCRSHIDASQGRLADSRRSRSRGVGTTLIATAEVALVKWVNDFRRDGIPVSSMMLKLRAMDIAQDIEIPDHAFSASYT